MTQQQQQASGLCFPLHLIDNQYQGVYSLRLSNHQHAQIRYHHKSCLVSISPEDRSGGHRDRHRPLRESHQEIRVRVFFPFLGRSSLASQSAA